MRTTNKYDIKRTVKRLFEEGGVRQTDMADALHMGESYLSRILSPTDELDGFVYGYLKNMGYLADRHPLVFNEIDTLVQTTFDGWRTPTRQLTEARSFDLFIIDINTLAGELFNAAMRRKSDSELKVIAARLSAVLAEFQRSLEPVAEMQEHLG